MINEKGKKKLKENKQDLKLKKIIKQKLIEEEMSNLEKKKYVPHFVQKKAFLTTPSPAISVSQNQVDLHGNLRKTVPKSLSNKNRLKTQMYLGSPKNKRNKKALFTSNNADTPSNKQTTFGNKKHIFKKQKNSQQTTKFDNLVNFKSGAKNKNKIKPQSTKHLTKKINFSKFNLNLSRAERPSGFLDAKYSINQNSAHGNSMQSDGFNLAKFSRKADFGFTKGKVFKTKKG